MLHTQSFQPEQIEAALKNGRPVDLSSLNRVERLEAINAFLSSQKLRPLEGLGDQTQGQIEFVGINALTPDPVKPGMFVTRVDFQCNSYEKGFNHLAFFNAGTTLHSGVVVVPVINDEYVLMCQQFRPLVGRHTIEVPRGFVGDLGDPNAIKSYGAALIELRQETGVDLTTERHQIAAEFSGWENTGTSVINNAFLRINIQLSPEQLNAVSSRVVNAEADFDHRIKTLLVPREDLKAVVQDNHTGYALFKAL